MEEMDRTRKGLEFTKSFIRQGIAEKLDVKEVISSSKSFNIADLGCSTGPNTFIAVQNIIESVLLKYKVNSDEHEPLEFQVFFNDLIANDFNTLFKSLPSDRQYFANGVPGPFHGRSFPKASLHFVHSSYALHWLSSVPKEVVDNNSAAYNKGGIYYGSTPSAVAEAFSAQFDRDMKSFLDARAQEIIIGGLMAFIILCKPDGATMSLCRTYIASTALETSVLELVKMGLISEAKVDSFNLPAYTPTPQQIKGLIETMVVSALKEWSRYLSLEMKHWLLLSQDWSMFQELFGRDLSRSTLETK